MFKKIPGNGVYKISLKGEIVNIDGSACPLIIDEGKVHLTMYGKNVLVSVTWLALVAYYEVDLPEPYTERIWDISFVPVNRKVTKSVTGKMMLIRRPIVIDKIYRVIPGFPNYAVSSIGKVIEVNSRNLVELKFDEYVDAWIYNPERNCNRSTKVHRLVALAWIGNNDWLDKFVVNHKDGNKHNPHKSNLEWTSPSGNAIHAFAIGLRDDNIPCKIRDIQTKKVTEFYSVRTACEFMGIPNETKLKSLLYQRKSKLIRDRYEIKLLNDYSQWFYRNMDKPLCPGRYILKVTYPDGNLETFYDVRSVIKKLKIWNTPSQGVDCVVENAIRMYPGMMIGVTDTYDKGVIQALNVKTDSIVEAESMSILAKLIERDVCSIKVALRADETRVSQGFAYRFKSDEMWNKNFTYYESSPVGISATNPNSNESLNFNSLREAAAYFKIDRSVIKMRLKKDVPWKDWTFKEIKNQM